MALIRCYEKLTQREKEILELLLNGMCNKEIASALHISEKTVETHLVHIYRKCGVSRRIEILLQHKNQGNS